MSRTGRTPTGSASRRRRAPSPAGAHEATAPDTVTPDDAATGAPAATGARGRAVKIKLFSAETPANLNASLLLGLVVLFVAFGLLMVLSSSSVEEFAAGNAFSMKFVRQFVFAIAGLPLMWLVSRVPLRTWTGRLSWLLLGAAIMLQLAVFTPLGFEVNGNRAWLDLGITSVQPAEFAKTALVAWLGFMVARKGELIRDWRHVVVPIGLPVAIVLALALAGKDLGTVMVIGALVLGALWFGGVPKRFLAVAAVLAAGGAIVMAAISPNRVARITSFLSGECDYEGFCWQTSHGLFALARGGILGVGLGNSTAKWSWLPEADNDFIFAIIGEEFGLIGAVAVILLFAALAVVLVRIWVETRDVAGRVVVGGVFAWFLFQAFVNIGVVLNLLPVLGVPLPFLSSGGSALVTTLIAVGLVLSVARQNAADERAAGRAVSASVSRSGARSRRTTPTSAPRTSAQRKDPAR